MQLETACSSISQMLTTLKLHNPTPATQNASLYWSCCKTVCTDSATGSLSMDLYTQTGVFDMCVVLNRQCLAHVALQTNCICNRIHVEQVAGT